MIFAVDWVFTIKNFVSELWTYGDDVKRTKELNKITKYMSLYD